MSDTDVVSEVSLGRTSTAWLGAVARAIPIVTIPSCAFAWRIGVWALNPLAASRMITGDYATYISSPNFLRTAPILTIPLASTPDHMAPTGSSLGLTDSTPILFPAYRVMNTLFPDRPTQLVGPIVLAAYVATFYALFALMRLLLERFDHEGRLHHVPTAFACATLLFLNPMFHARVVHPSLTHQWIILWAVYTVLRDGPHPTNRTKHATLGQAAAAATIQPYLLPVVVLLHVPTIYRGLRARLAPTVGFLALYVGTIAALSFLLGYIQPGARTSSYGFGRYSANVLFLVDPGAWSRLLPDIPTLPDTWEGQGYLGGGVLLATVVSVGVLASVGPAALRAYLGPFTWPAAAGALLAGFAVLPAIYVGEARVVDLQRLLEPLESVMGIFRANGRYVWLASWSFGIASVGALILVRHRIARYVILGGLVAVQVADLDPPPLARRSSSDYEAVASVLLSMREMGATRIEIMPPLIVKACAGREIPISEVEPIVLAASVLRMSINSGYPSRSTSQFEREICRDQVEEFVRGVRHADVVYVVNARSRESNEMSCRPITPSLVACRS